EAVGRIARKAIDRKTGARGLRSIMEGILLDTMFDLPSLEGVEEVMISKEAVEGTARPLYIYADRADRAGARGAAEGAPWRPPSRDPGTRPELRTPTARLAMVEGRSHHLQMTRMAQ